jgi:hypothetical protein
VEESRSNIYLQSEAFNTSPNTTGNATITANTTTSPDGLVNADKLVENASTGNKEVYQPLGTITSGTYYTVSVFAKAAERNIFRFAMDTVRFGSDTNAYFNLSSGTVTTTTGGVTSASIIPYPNGWYRCTATFLPTSTGSSAVYITLIQSGTTSNYTGDGTSGVYLWGAQVEAGAFPTSYIPTVASTVTRSADNASMTGTNFSSWYNQSEGTIVTNTKFDGAPITGSINRTVSYIRGSAPSIPSTWQLWWESFNTIATLNYNGSSYDATIIQSGTTVSQGQRVKFASALKTNDFAQSQNGGTIQTDTSVTLSSNYIAMDIGSTIPYSSNYLNGTISQLSYYPKRLTNSQLQNLTK